NGAGAVPGRKRLLHSRGKCGLLKAFPRRGVRLKCDSLTRRPIVKRFFLLALAAGVLAAAPARAANPVIVMQTSMGTIKIELFEDKAPVTVRNILQYVDDKFYDGTIFHRVPRLQSGQVFVIQGGGFEPGMKQKKTRPPIKNEADNMLSN